MRGRTAVIAGLATAGVVFGTSTAYADANYVLTTDTHRTGLAVWTESRWELKVCDDVSDGWTVVGWIYRPNPGNPSTGPTEVNLTDSTGNGICNTDARWIAPGVNIHIKVCLLRGSTIKNCSYNRIPR